MPRLSNLMEEGTILRWLKTDGADVQRGDDLVEIETDKANMICEADASGRLEITAPEGATRPVGSTIAYIGDRDPVAVTGSPIETSSTSPEPGLTPTTSSHSPSSPAVNASPVARRLAQRLGVDLTAIRGSGAGGRILTEDVESAATSAHADATASRHDSRGQVTRVEVSKAQKIIADRMVDAKRDAPEFTLTKTVDMTDAVAARALLADPDGAPPPSLNDFIVKAAALALREFPRVNGSFRDGAFELYERINIGVAVDAPDTLLVPVIFDADKKTVEEIAEQTRSVAARARNGQLTPAELDGGTFTVSNLGMMGVDSFSAIINHGQAAILAVGSVQPVPVLADGKLTERQQLTLTLTCDHRNLYGAEAARFMARVAELLRSSAALSQI